MQRFKDRNEKGINNTMKVLIHLQRCESRRPHHSRKLIYLLSCTFSLPLFKRLITPQEE